MTTMADGERPATTSARDSSLESSVAGDDEAVVEKNGNGDDGARHSSRFGSIGRPGNGGASPHSTTTDKDKSRDVEIREAPGAQQVASIANGPADVPACVVWGTVVLALVSVALYLLGQTTPMWALGASATLSFFPETGLEEVDSDWPSYDMTLMFSIEACLKTGMPAEMFLGFVLFCFSGLWPHVKLALMLVCWLVPMGHRQRHVLLYWADTLGKFSFADPLVVVMLMVAFNSSIDLGSGSFLFTPLVTALAISNPGLDPATVANVHLQLDIQALDGIFCFCGGVWLSLLLGGVVEHYNSRTISAVATPMLTKGDGSGALMVQEHPFRTRSKYVALAVLSPVLFLMVSSLCLPLLLRTVDGVMAFLIAIFGWGPVPLSTPITENLTFASIIDFVFGLGGAGYAFLAVTVIAFAIAAPLLRGPALAALWLPPKSLHRQHLLHTSLNTVAIFDALPVFIFAMVLVIIEIRSISEAIVFAWCDPVAAVMLTIAETCPLVPVSPFVSKVVGTAVARSPQLAEVADAVASHCDHITELVTAFNIEQCLDISLAIEPGFLCALLSCVLAYAATLLLSYPSSIEIYGQDFFELPICVRKSGWCCCFCSSGTFTGVEEPLSSGADDFPVAPPALDRVTVVDSTGVVPPEPAA